MKSGHVSPTEAVDEVNIMIDSLLPDHGEVHSFDCRHFQDARLGYLVFSVGTSLNDLLNLIENQPPDVPGQLLSLYFN